MRKRGTGGERGGRRTGEIMRERHNGESMKETILTNRGRQTCKEEEENTENIEEIAQRRTMKRHKKGRTFQNIRHKTQHTDIES